MDTIISDEWHELPRNHRDVLVVLAVDANLSITEVNRALGREQSGYGRIHSTLSDLQDRGLVRVERDETQRGHPSRQSLTADGEALVRANVVKPARLIEAAEVLES